MSAPAQALDLATGTQRVAGVPAAHLVIARKGGRIYTPLPKMWIGIGIAMVCLLCQFTGADGDAAVLLLSVAGTCYWLFCVHRIHKVLSEFTLSTYPISPRKAVGFQFIPIVEYYWFFRWTRQIARWIDNENGKVTMAKVWPGLLLASTSLLGWFAAFKSLRLFLVFGFGIYLTRKLRAVLPPCRPYCLKRQHQWSLAMSAGIGATFSFVLVQAIREFYDAHSVDKFKELAAIFLVSVGVLIFLEPMFERLRTTLGIAENHPALHKRKSWFLRLAVFAILVVTSFFHGLLESKIEKSLTIDWFGTITMVMAALLLTGGITYCWISAAHRNPSHAARSGLILGGLISLLIFLGTVDTHVEEKDHSQDTFVQHAVHYALPGVPPRVSDDLADRNFHQAETDLDKGSGLKEMNLIFTMPWPLLGLMGGLVVDRRWGRNKAITLTASLLGGAVLYEVLLRITGHLASPGEMISQLSVALGWGLAIIVCSSSRILTPEESAKSA